MHPGHFATQQGTPFYPAGMSAADWSTLVFTLPRRKMAWVHPTMATFFQNCTLILDKYPVVSENETLPPAISPAEVTLGSKTPGVVTICGWSAAGRRPTSGLQQQLQGSCARVRRIQNARRRNHLHNRVHPGHFATQQGTPFYPAGMSAADWSTLVFTLPRRKMTWVHPVVSFPHKKRTQKSQHTHTR